MLLSVMIDDGVLEVHRAPLAVREASVVEHLQEDVPDVGVRLLDLVEENDRIADGAGEPARCELAPLLRIRRIPAAPR